MKRRLRLACSLAALLTVQLAALAPAAPAAAAPGDLLCTATSVITYSPGLTLTPSPQLVTWDVKYSGCTSTTGAAVSGGGRQGHVTNTRGCLALPASISGTRTITWDDNTTSTVDSTGQATDVAGQTVYTITGTVTAGRFLGDTFTEIIVQASLDPIACATTGVKSQTGVGTLTLG